jgi:hypothetical protein
VWQRYDPDGGVLQCPAQSEVEERVLARGVEVYGSRTDFGFRSDPGDFGSVIPILDENFSRGIGDLVQSIGCALPWHF